MAEYIDREKLYNDIEENSSAYYSEEVEIKNECLSMISCAETADVVPRSEVEKAEQEVAREIFEKIRKEIELALDSNYKARMGGVSDNFISLINGKISALRGIDDFIAELEKQYIGEQK